MLSVFSGSVPDQAQTGIGHDFKKSGGSRRARLEAVANGWKRVYQQSGGVLPKPVVIGGNLSNSYTDSLGGIFVEIKGGTFDMGSHVWTGSS